MRTFLLLLLPQWRTKKCVPFTKSVAWRCRCRNKYDTSEIFLLLIICHSHTRHTWTFVNFSYDTFFIFSHISISFSLLSVSISLVSISISCSFNLYAFLFFSFHDTGQFEENVWPSLRSIFCRKLLENCFSQTITFTINEYCIRSLLASSIPLNYWQISVIGISSC